MGVGKEFVTPFFTVFSCMYIGIPVVTTTPVPSGAIISTSTSTSLTPKPTAAAETTGEKVILNSYIRTSPRFFIIQGRLPCDHSFILFAGHGRSHWQSCCWLVGV